jgi:uncharacterized membrane protein SirB2
MRESRHLLAVACICKDTLKLLQGLHLLCTTSRLVYTDESAYLTMYLKRISQGAAEAP